MVWHHRWLNPLRATRISGQSSTGIQASYMIWLWIIQEISSLPLVDGEHLWAIYRKSDITLAKLTFVYRSKIKIPNSSRPAGKVSFNPGIKFMAFASCWSMEGACCRKRTTTKPKFHLGLVFLVWRSLPQVSVVITTGMIQEVYLPTILDDDLTCL